ncbi:hypothetical protein MHZ92_07310 [Sporosarcina sp. ACRSL]|uniref:hypothetical protein n=1 Tax=Sporosarcina sp. ACRSL TaxID=2918215 RepID=UPI001EF3D672|nr:hypothetical protein [Sporosarcina sp. ACRSL]MCG7343935.1 hypothetical protein [Sporosarcina sp. ACRSL]
MRMSVERFSYLHEREIDEWMNLIKLSFRPDVPEDVEQIRKAVSLVRKSAIHDVRLSSDMTMIEATVNDGDANVRLAPPSVATCTCDEDDWCVHKMTVVFHLYSQFHSMTEWLHVWQRREAEQMALTISERTPEAWNDVLYRLTMPLRKIEAGDSPNVFIHESSLMDQKVIPLSPFEWEWKPLFELFYRLHLLEAGWPYARVHLEEANHFTYRQWQVKMWVNEQIDKLRDIGKSLGKTPRLFETDAFYTALKTQVREFVSKSAGLFEVRLQIYAIMWEFLYKDKASQEKELALLLDGDSVDAAFFAAYFNLTKGDDKTLAEIAERTGGELVGHWLPLADRAAEMEDINSLSIILETIYPYIGKFFEQLTFSNDRYHFIRKIDGLLEEADFPEKQREELFMIYGEDGVSAFGDFLIERERFAEWAALMHRFNIPYDGIEPDTLKFVLANDPASVMPLLHTYAMRFIQEKNRHSYRRAVRLFKSMKAGAKKSGKADFWNRYIDTVREQYRRLRALSEEMEKGNLNL